jgi:hypothetical protein
MRYFDVSKDAAGGNCRMLYPEKSAVTPDQDRAPI